VDNKTHSKAYYRRLTVKTQTAHFWLRYEYHKKIIHCLVQLDQDIRTSAQSRTPYCRVFRRQTCSYGIEMMKDEMGGLW
jgi:hypothetical protein